MALNAERSSHGSDRRRRLIAVEEDLHSSELLAEYGIVSLPIASRTAPIHQSGDRIVRRLVSQKLWKHILLICGATVVAALAVATTYFRQQLPPAFPVEQITRAVAGIELLIAGQFSILIGWLRCRSQVDYRGRYRSWRWFGAVLMIAGCVTLADLQPTLSTLLTDLVEPLTGNISAARPALTVVLGCSLILLLMSRIVPDTGRNRVAQLLILFAGVPAILNVVEVSDPSSQLLPSVTSPHLMVAASHLLFTAVLLHARFVAWISNDPPLPAVRKADVLKVESDEVDGDKAKAQTDKPSAECSEAAKLVVAKDVNPVVSEQSPEPESAQVSAATKETLPDSEHASTESEPAATRKKTRSTRRKKKYRKAG